ncbi:MAG: 2OG-Fe(II) oxygenase [uncultured Thiotrichaceae bacterium]|uniref:2OG-Fe(II) oxygenase n=1 Tax=uncultured Thiotrichaceae bacterium TaxID=298394 RepID=A0A6S6U437_9GAMM|nr:MAG: 2OG-Fe(II) oxygenase [uncultured Thiotrichaceae bacterium]
MSGIREVSPGSFIFEKKDALPDFLCDDMVKRFEAQPEDQNRGRVGSDVGENTQLKKTTDIFVSNKSHWKDVDNNLFRSLALALQEFKEAYPFFADMSRFKDMGYNLQRYQPGEFYHWHIDGDNQELATRQLVALWYLNDVPAPGGATEFYYQNVSVQPEKGKLMLFPPFWTHQHRAQEILSGSKYIATTWLHFR